MSILTKEQYMERIQGIIGDNNDDESLSLVEDLTDTFTELETRSTDSTDWKKKYEENDAQWRNKYRERFFHGRTNEDEEQEFEDEEEKRRTKITKFSQLFETKEG